MKQLEKKDCKTVWKEVNKKGALRNFEQILLQKFLKKGMEFFYMYWRLIDTFFVMYL